MIDVGKDLQTAYDDGYQKGKRDAQQWIPCKERLPEKSDDVVLVTVIDARRIRDIYLMRCDEVESAYIAKWISAWMPLPEPYKEENK